MNADIKTIKQLADIMEEKGLTRLQLHQNELEIVLERTVSAQAAYATAQMAAPAGPIATAANPQAAAPNIEKEADTPTPADGTRSLNAPLVGVGYIAAEPEAAPFVAVGDKVKKGQVLCIIEAMKVMNEFTAPEDCEIAAICFEDGALIEYGQALFQIH